MKPTDLSRCTPVRMRVITSSLDICPVVVLDSKPGAVTPDPRTVKEGEELLVKVIGIDSCARIGREVAQRALVHMPEIGVEPRARDLGRVEERQRTIERRGVGSATLGECKQLGGRCPRCG